MSANFRWKECRPPTTVNVRKLESCGIKISQCIFGFITKHACDRRTDRQAGRQTDGQNHDPQARAGIAALRGKNGVI